MASRGRPCSTTRDTEQMLRRRMLWLFASTLGGDAFGPSGRWFWSAAAARCSASAACDVPTCFGFRIMRS
jgi:hypothetical protein